MEKVTAEKLVARINALTEPLSRLLQAIDEIEDEDTKRKLRRAAARIVADIETELVLPISDIYPDLKGLEERSEGWSGQA